MSRLVTVTGLACLLLGLVATGCAQQAPATQATATKPAAAATEAARTPTPLATSAPAPVDYPTRPITLIVGQAAGGSTDVGSRIAASLVEKELGQPVVVVNKTGAGGQVAWTELAQAQPDGYTWGVANLPALNTVILNPERKATFGIEAFEPVVNQVLDQGLIVAKPGGPYKTLKDLVEDAKKRPGQITIGVAGLLSHGHFGVLSLQKAAGVKFRVVVIDSSPQMATSVMGGQLDVAFDRVASWATRVQAGELHALAVADKERSPFLPDVPTTVEQGFPDVITGSAMGIIVPKGVPEPIIKRIEAAYLKAMENPEFLQKMQQSGQRVKIMGRDEYRAYVMEWHERTKKMLELAKE